MPLVGLGRTVRRRVQRQGLEGCSAVRAGVSRDDEQARRELEAARALTMRHLVRGVREPLRPEEVQERARSGAFTGGEVSDGRMVVGEPKVVVERLLELKQRAQADEVVIVTPSLDRARRADRFTAIAEGWRSAAWCDDYALCRNEGAGPSWPPPLRLRSANHACDFPLQRLNDVGEVFPDQEHSSEVTMWLEDGAVMFRVGSFGTTLEWTAPEAREVGLALQELAERSKS